MAKYELRLRAREMRSKGESVKYIASVLGVSKGTSSLWVRDIILSVEQLEKLKGNSLRGAERGRVQSAFLQKQKRINLQNSCIKAGMREIKVLSDRELMIAGLALYWAEGCKKTRRVEFCNSDPKLINFMINWLNVCFGIPRNRLTAVVGINEMHIRRELEVVSYWSKITQLPKTQFRRTSFKHTNNKKVYENYYRYYGTLSIRVLKPAAYYYKILGLIEGLACQCSSTAEQSHHKREVTGPNPVAGTSIYNSIQENPVH